MLTVDTLSTPLGQYAQWFGWFNTPHPNAKQALSQHIRVRHKHATSKVKRWFRGTVLRVYTNVQHMHNQE